MKVSTFLGHFTRKALRQAVKAIVLCNNDNPDWVIEMTTLSDEGLERMYKSDRKVSDWNMTATTLYIYVK